MYTSETFSTGYAFRLFIVLLLFLCGYAPIQAGVIHTKEPPLFFDDGERDSLFFALRQQQSYLGRFPGNKKVIIGDTTYTINHLLQSIKAFESILASDPAPLELDRLIRQDFTILQASGRSSSKQNDMLVTGYFLPTLQGSLKKSFPYLYPVYSPPGDLLQYTGRSGSKKIGRTDRHGKLQPYWTREEVETENRATGYELAYLKDPFDAFLLQVQGSGKIQLPDGRIRSINYATHNGHSYSSIGKLLVDKGLMTLDEASIPSIRQYLQDHPGEQQQIFHHNRRFIFFHWGDEKPAKGSLGLPLTPGRSIAIDRKVLPTAMIGYLVSEKPLLDENKTIIGWVPLQRFVLPQDSGAAIKGAGRVDFFWGTGNYAEIAAGAMKSKGQLYFLIKK